MSTRRRAAIAALAALAALVLGTLPAGCEEPLQPVSEPPTLLAEAGDYTMWARPKNRAERQPVVAPHGGFVDIYINDVVVADQAMVLPEGLPAWSDEAMVVLAGYDAMEGGSLVQVAVMQKRDGVWAWEQYDGSSDEPRFSGRPDVCVGCHSAGEDFVRSFRLPDPPPEA
ncbi:hypothetical protein OV203_18725 [Nannocystis sp. ILAH1]|uniref:hypothetical protein n=1 Tax=Nannocystis sp. ILAH1 TaxID=2996789 RepID=UPI0022704559|nr:hypothetical protein [Nannocystis sp. ILAH1]MCY0989179.1 hypothetical protein [Nannocystis sp. ILAH1]